MLDGDGSARDDGYQLASLNVAEDEVIRAGAEIGRDRMPKRLSPERAGARVAQPRWIRNSGHLQVRWLGGAR